MCLITARLVLIRRRNVEMPSKYSVASAEKLCAVLNSFAGWAGLTDHMSLIGGRLETWQRLADTVLNQAALAKLKAIGLAIGGQSPYFRWAEEQLALEAADASKTGNPCGSKC